MRTTVDEELRRLRERAYGPDADIDRDAVARARLDRLQNPRPAEDAGGRTAAEHRHPPRVRGAHRRLFALLIGVTAIAATASTALVMTLATEPEPTDPVEVAATLEPDPTLPWLTQVDSDSRTPDGGVRYADYLGVAVVSTVVDMQSTCLYVLPTPTGGALAGGCGAGPFPARAVIVVTGDMPEGLTARHPPGTALQFELVRDVVIVQAADTEERETG